MAACPPKNSDQWKAIEAKVGKHNAYKMFIRYGSNDKAVDTIERILDPNRYTIDEKIKNIEAMSEKTSFVDSPDPVSGEKQHKYFAKKGDGTRGKELKSVSRVLDENEDTEYNGTDAGRIYAEKGSEIHRVFEDYINGVSDTNIKARMLSHGIPESILGDVKNFVRKLREKGVVKAEVILGDHENDIAGATDIIWYKYDGTIDIIDIKTAHRTRSTQGPIWDPIHHFGGYKSRRYPTQEEFYGKLVERAVGQPVSKKWILPIELSYKDNNPNNQFNSVKMLPAEDTSKYGYSDAARRIVDEYFGEAEVVVRPSLISTDDSTDLMEEITGSPQGRNVDFDSEAAWILSRKNKKGEYKAGNEWRRLRSSDPVAQKQQIIEEFLRRRDNAQRNVTESLINYANSGNDAFLDDPGQAANNIAVNAKLWIDFYKKDKVEIYDLNKIEGFENKKGWIVFQRGNVYDLLYMGSDQLSDDIQMKNRGTLFGDFMTKGQARELLESNLANTRKDARVLEGAFIMMALKNSIKEAEFERAFVYSAYDNSAKSPFEIKMKDLLPVIEKMKDNSKFQQIIPLSMRNMFTDKSLFDPNTYKQNYVKAYQDYIRQNSLVKERNQRGLTTALESYVQNKDDSKLLELRVLDAIQWLSSKNDPDYQRELYLLSQMYYELRGVNTTTDPIDIGRKVLHMPTAFRNSVMSDLVIQTQNSLNRFKNQFKDHKKKSDPVTLKLFKSSGVLSQTQNYLMADTTGMYNPLFQKKDYTVTETGEIKNLSTFSLIDENSPEFTQLTSQQQAYITMFNDAVQDGAKKLGIGDGWVRGRIPLVRKTALRQLTQAAQGKLSKKRFQSIIDGAFNDNFIFTGDNLQADPKNVLNLFSDQVNTVMSDPRMGKLGLTEDGHVDQNKYDEYETNLEVVLDMFMINANKVDVLTTAGWVFDAAKALLDYQKSFFFEESLGGNLDWIQVWRNAMLNNRDKVDTPLDKKAMGVVKPTNFLASLAIIGFKPTTALVATMGQQFTLINRSIANVFHSSGLFGPISWAKALGTVLNPSNYPKIDAIMQEYNLFDMDVSSLQSSQRRKADRFIGNTKYAYMFLRAGDWFTRAQAIVAQMHHDGSWDAHSMVEGELIYNENNDKRFNGTGRYNLEEGRALKKAISYELEQEGFMNGDRMMRAYDNNLANKHKDLADTTFGGMDKETKGFYNYTWFGKLLGLFRSWLPARIDAVIQKPGPKRIAGDYQFIRDSEGELQPVWKGLYVEGLFYTLRTLSFNVKQLLKQQETKPLNEAQKANLGKMAADFTVIGSMLLTATMLPEDDDSRLDEESANLLLRSMQDVMVTYILHKEAERLFTVPAFLAYLNRLIDTTIHVMSGIPDGDIELERVMRITPFAQEYRILQEYEF